MKRAMLSLNPDALSYTPLDKRITEVKGKIADLSMSHSRTEQCQFQDEASSGSDNHANEELPTSSNLTEMDPKDLRDPTKKQQVDDSHEMDLAYLAFLFPNISPQCLEDVYFLTERDMEYSIDMLNELESSPVDFTEQQPDSLDTAGASTSQVTDSECKVMATGFSTMKSSFGNSK